MARKTASLWYVAMATAMTLLTASVMSFSSQFGSHLDSVPAGPGINDNGWVELFVGVASSYIHPYRSGSAGNLEIALALARNNLRPKNKVVT